MIELIDFSQIKILSILIFVMEKKLIKSIGQIT